MKNNSLLLLVLGIAAYYLYEHSQSQQGNSQIPCATGFTNVNGTCVQNPTTGSGNTSFIPCATGYVPFTLSDGTQTCIAAPGTDYSNDPSISDLLI